LKFISELRSITCHMGSRLLPDTGEHDPHIAQPGRLVLDLPMPVGWRAELI